MGPDFQYTLEFFYFVVNRFNNWLWGKHNRVRKIPGLSQEYWRNDLCQIRWVVFVFFFLQLYTVPFTSWIPTDLTSLFSVPFSWNEPLWPIFYEWNCPSLLGMSLSMYLWISNISVITMVERNNCQNKEKRRWIFYLVIINALSQSFLANICK